MRNIKNTHPLISVVMPVYNAGDYLVAAVQSILKQSYTNFEFIIVDDASTDNSLSILKEYAKKDPRIKLLRNKKNLGVSRAVKKAIDMAKGSYLARMDADDVAHSERLEKQVMYLASHQETVAVGTQCNVIDADSNIVGVKHFPTRHEDIYKYIFTLIPLQQPSLMIARHKLPKNFRYYVDGMNTAEEVELIFKLFRYGKVENLKETLLDYRIHGKNTSLNDIKKTFLLTLISRVKAVSTYGYRPTVSGVCITFAETIAILVLPQSVIMSVYSMAKHLYKKHYRFIANKLAITPSPAV